MVGASARPDSLTVNSTGDRAYVANTQADYMSILDVDNGKELARVMVGRGGRAIVLSPDEKYAYISVENLNQLAVIDLATYQVVRRVEVGPSPRGIALCKPLMRIYASDFSRSESQLSSGNAVSIVDVSDPLKAQYVGEIKVGLGPCSVSVLTR